ncbi:hypothetical protein Tco_0862117 [Tanacetum coccineum]
MLYMSICCCYYSLPTQLLFELEKKLGLIWCFNIYRANNWYTKIKNEEIEIGPVDVEWNKAIGNRMKKQRSGYKRDDVVLLDVITAAIGFMITSFGLRWSLESFVLEEKGELDEGEKEVVGRSGGGVLHSKELASPEQTTSELAIPGQTATGKESSNPFIAGSLPKLYISVIHFQVMRIVLNLLN